MRIKFGQGQHGHGVSINDGYPTWIPESQLTDALEYADNNTKYGDFVEIYPGVMHDDKITWREVPIMEYLVGKYEFME